jgi:hypothetical protein
MKEDVYLDEIENAFDPFDIFGFGIQAYFQTLRILIIAFSMCTIAAIPMMVMYSEGKGMSNMIGTSFMTDLSLGNLGQTQPVCVHQYLGMNFIQDIKCRNRQFLTEIKTFGIIPAGKRDQVVNHCGSSEKPKIVNDCTKKWMNGEDLVKRWDATCRGEKKC